MHRSLLDLANQGIRHPVGKVFCAGSPDNSPAARQRFHLIGCTRARRRQTETISQENGVVVSQGGFASEVQDVATAME